MKFKNFLGNEKLKNQIADLIESKRLPQAIILEGESGLGKRTFARDIATALACRSDGEKPCYNCAQCKKAQKGIHPDIYEYSPDGKTFKIDSVREVINDVFMSPNEAEHKIYILGNAHLMNEAAQNALLKILEEPPAYAVFILTVENKSAMLETVLSRAVVLSVDGVNPKDGAEYIANKNQDIDYNEALEAVSIFRGNIGKAEESLTDGNMSRVVEITENISNAISSENEYDLMKSVSVFQKEKQFLSSSLELLKIIFRDALVYSEKSEIISGRFDAVKKIASVFTKKEIFELIRAVELLLDMAEKNANNALLTTKICYTLREAVNR